MLKLDISCFATSVDQDQPYDSADQDSQFVKHVLKLENWISVECVVHSRLNIQRDNGQSN